MKDNVFYADRLIRIIADALSGYAPDLAGLDADDLMNIINFSVKHKVHGLIVYALKDMASLPPEVCDRVNSLKNMIVASEIMHINKNREFKLLVGALEEARISYHVMKGYAIAKKYPAPEFRLMVDIDVFVLMQDFQRSTEVFEALGYEKQEEYEKSFCHLGYFKSGAYFLEQHFSLGYENFIGPRKMNIWYDEIVENRVRRELEGTEYTAMGDNDEFIFLFIHLKNHLLGMCGNLKMLVEFGIILKAGGLDFDYINKHLDLLELRTIASPILYLCRKYFGVTIPGFEGDDGKETAEKLLSDVALLNDHRLVHEGVPSYMFLPIVRHKISKPLVYLQEILRNLIVYKRGWKDSVDRAFRVCGIFYGRFDLLYDIGAI